MRPPAPSFGVRQICSGSAPRSMAGKKDLVIEIEPAVINGLGINLHGRLQPVMSEIVANSWDADAGTVEIRLPEGGIGTESKIVVKDDGTGMSRDDIVDKYLRIGRERRVEEGTDTTGRGRRVMGRKGIGNLSVFGVARTVTVETAKGGRRTEFRTNVGDILDCARKRIPYYPQVIADDERTPDADGTTVTLTDLKGGGPRRCRRRPARGCKALFSDREGVQGPRQRRCAEAVRQDGPHRSRERVENQRRIRRTKGKRRQLESFRQDRGI